MEANKYTCEYVIPGDEIMKYNKFLDNVKLCNLKGFNKLLCNICFNIAQEPMECLLCDNITCKLCAVTWKE
jgi:hypothetical protein